MVLQSAKPTYLPGVPCWVDAVVPEPRAVARFYANVLGWTFDAASTPEGSEYLLARLGGDDVAGIAGIAPGSGVPPHWITYVSVDALEPALRRVTDAGGSVLVEPLDAAPAGRFAVITDPQGAGIGLWEPQTRDGAQRVNEPSAWAMSSLLTPALHPALRFYQDVFGWTVTPYGNGPERIVLLHVPGYVGGTPTQPVPRDVVAVAVEDPKVSEPHWTVDFWIDDLRAALQRIEECGGRVIMPPFDIATFIRTVVADPQGAIFTLSELAKERL